MTGSRRRWLWLIPVALVALGVARLRFDVEVLNLLPDDAPVVQGLKLYQQNFANARELILTVRGPDAEATETAARSLAEKLRRLTNDVAEVSWQPPWLERPLDSAELMASMWLNQPPALFAGLASRLAPTNLVSVLSAAREQLTTSMSPADIARLSYDPYGLLQLPESVTAGAASFGQGQELFASADGTLRLVFVQATTELGSYRECRGWLERVQKTVDEWRTAEPRPGLVIRYTGRPAFVTEIAGGMEADMTGSVGFTSLVIAVLFWLAHRRWRPMLWLLTLLALILACTLALGGLIFGAINVVSLGFAAILLGLAVDYGVVHYQEALAKPDAIVPEIRRAIGPSIFWAAVTTISAFLVLNFSGLPGLARLGSLVAIGVALSAFVMLFLFLPPLFRDRLRRREEQIAARIHPSPAAEQAASMQPSPIPAAARRLVFAATVAVVAGAVGVLSFGLPRMDNSANALRPQKSAAYATLDEIKANFSRDREPLWILTTGTNETEIAHRLERANAALTIAVSNGSIASFTLPTALWPQPENQTANRPGAMQLVSQRETFRSTAQAQGFNPDALKMTDAILDAWRVAAAGDGVFWPSNRLSRWAVEKMTARPKGKLLAVGFVFPATNSPVSLKSVAPWADMVSRDGFVVSGWELLGASILQSVQKNLWWVVLPMVVLILLSLWLAFRRPTEILLSLAVLGLSGVCLLAVMRLMGWSWNLLNLMALPLILGSGVDYGIFMQLALRRHHGDWRAAHRSVGRALLLCGGTAVAGFGSLSWSTNAGMASLGAVCAVGIGCNMLISVLLLPVWWRAAVKLSANANGDVSTTPSGLYGPALWRLALAAARILPATITTGCCRMALRVYWSLASDRREVVVKNLLPVFSNDRAAAERTSRNLFDEFGRKLADLWRYESGHNVNGLFGRLDGWEHFTAAKARGRGVLLLTPHLGNWEFGAPLLAERGVDLLVITLAEPGRGFTEMRQASRARRGIETLVIGEDPFAFVEIIKRLEAGATVALLVDRPPAASAVSVELFGRSFMSSIAAAELARASGCSLLPVILPRVGGGYAACLMPEVAYDRRELATREARQRLTQQIMRAFEPAIRQHPDQWFHFVPVWPKS